MNSVEPVATSSGDRQVTRPVFPFSVQGVMRANSVSPLRNREPLFLTVLKRHVRTSLVSAGSVAMSTNGVRVPLATGRRGFTSTALENGIFCQRLVISQLRKVPVHLGLGHRITRQAEAVPRRVSGLDVPGVVPGRVATLALPCDGAVSQRVYRYARPRLVGGLLRRVAARKWRLQQAG